MASSLGNVLETFWQECLEPTVQAAALPALWHAFFTPRSAYWMPYERVPGIDDLNFRLFDRNLYDQATVNFLYTATQAVENAGLALLEGAHSAKSKHIAGYPAGRVGVFVGTSVGGISTFIDSYLNHLLKRLGSTLELPGGEIQLPHGKRFNPFACARFMPNSPASSVGILLGAQGKARSFNYACASSTIAVGEAFNSVSRGEVDCAIAGGTEYLMDPYGAIFRSFDIAGILTRSTDGPQACNRPFDQHRSGLLYAQGASASLILEEREQALARGAPIYAEIKSYAENFEAHSLMSVDPSGEAIERLLHDLLGKVGYQPGDVDYINAHGTGTLTSDQVESEVIARMFGSRVAVNSSKSLLGHTFGASGALEAVISCLSIKHQILHPSLNAASPIADLNLVQQPLRQKVDTVISQNFGFGGHNAALLFARP
ncbi:beta-ketoacyl-[acyl-carrier-protein] synthase family protein [Pseudomonas sp. TNT2022 ID681]|uniref:Beta-ketoacyl-[acyl-carrier-protein] synthase family protein n=1 Tax=Pseudomonas fontis TaxID=2942633 RepID=A0ABT5NRI4_9PSED|nr:beta-ketoacyl-[acyl-carrier-protein] synthase family protein [Pseudomonas fontis]MDD0990771.1 beta-ketoacyl-[acyl-carrier-protein] synthase family protein [Pseudomonas fontis]